MKGPVIGFYFYTPNILFAFNGETFFIEMQLGWFMFYEAKEARKIDQAERMAMGLEELKEEHEYMRISIKRHALANHETLAYLRV